MRLVTYLREQRERVGVVLEDQVVDLAALAHHAGSPSPSFESMTAFLQSGGKAQEHAERLLAKFPAPELAQLPLTDLLSAVTLQASVPRPGKIIALGLNYRDHAIESGMAIPETIRKRMHQAGKGAAARKEGVAIAVESLMGVRDRVAGTYLMPPLRRYEMAAEIIAALGKDRSLSAAVRGQAEQAATG